MWDWDTIALPISETPSICATSLPETTAASPITPEFTSSETETAATTPITPELTPSKTIPPSENMPQQTQYATTNTSSTSP